LAIVVALSAGIWFEGHQDLPFIFISGDERNYAEIGRRLATGRGLTTGVIYPIEVEWGVHEMHPSLLRPPLWPLVLAGAFTIGPPTEVSAHVAVGLFFVITCVLAFSIGARLGGNVAGLVAGMATALTPALGTYTMLAGTEMLLALWIALVALLLVRESNALWVGFVCGLAYFTRYNAGILLPACLLFLAPGKPRWKPYASCLAGFILACAPWWIRNFIVTGDPFFSLYTATLWAEPGVIPGSVLFLLEAPEVAILHPLLRAYESIPAAILVSPVPTANLVAFAGLLLGCFYWSRPHLAISSAYFLSKVAVAFVVIRSRYMIPFLPAVIALGSAAWTLYGGRVGKYALGLVLLVPFLPTIPLPDPIENVMMGSIEVAKDRTRSHGDAPEHFFRDMKAVTNCLDKSSVVIASDATTVAWYADAVAIQMPLRDDDFWQVVETHPVEFVVGAGPFRQASPGFRDTFVRRTDCGPNTFERRG